jgi:hypothetical protein
VSGHIRTLYHAFPQSLNTIKKLNENYDFHVYASFWDNQDGRVYKINDPHHYIANLTNVPFSLEKDFIHDWFMSLGVKSCEIKMLDHSLMDDLFEKGHSLIDFTNKHLLPQYFSTKSCFSMVPYNQYSHVIRIRPDIVIKDFPSLDSIKEELITNLYAWYNDKAKDEFENEMIWIAKNNIAKESASIYDKIINNCHPYGKNPLKYGEAMTGRHFFAMKCTKSRFNFNYRVAR